MKSTFRTNLNNLRKLTKRSQQEFALCLHTTLQRVSGGECDPVEPSLFIVLKIIRVLGVTFDELTEGIE